ncbi:hypothetical protein Paride_0195 [Pseudomonas phage Paride]|nr:hypothetical protein Deiofobo_0195 [Pseudomonas phage Deifobo]WPK39905.1 hypothetical protein ETTORE_0196 [Pseudomonas phage Ettore]WPK40425.1 hypothetical protein Paride_0195 [Pseudomonas phage Paride]
MNINLILLLQRCTSVIGGFQRGGATLIHIYSDFNLSAIMTLYKRRCKCIVFTDILFNDIKDGSIDIIIYISKNANLIHDKFAYIDTSVTDESSVPLHDMTGI